jgi:hypothetical protein
VGNTGRKQLLCPAGYPDGLGQESLCQKLLVRCDLLVYYVFSPDMFALGTQVLLPEAANVWSQELGSLLWSKKYFTMVLA